MALKRIYISRHGYRANWLPEPHPPNPTGIDSDPPLAPHGVDQAKQLAAYLTSLPDNEKPQFILSSPFYRCVETGRPIAEMLSLSIALERGVGEWYKKNRKIIPEPADYNRLRSFFNNVLVEESFWPRDDTVGVIPNLSGESEEEIFQRAEEFWVKFIPVFESRFPEFENVLIITHAATKIALGLSLLKLKGVRDYLDDNKTTLRAGACSLDLYRRAGLNWELKMNGNCDFLTEGEEMNWNFHSGFEAGSDEDIKARKEEERKKKLKKQELAEKAEDESVRETTPVTELASGDIDIPEEEYKDFYITIDIPMIGKTQDFEESNSLETPRSKNNIIKPSAHFQLTELDNDNPLIKLSNNSNIGGSNELGGNNDSLNNLSVIDGKIYQTDWKKLVGTDLIFDDYGALIGQVNEHLLCNEHVKIVPRESNKVKEEAEDDEDLLERDDESKTQHETQTQFLKKAIKTAKKKSTA
ncbi:transcription factor TFIIIC, tau55 subunit [Suhomyces tanzawaensis NRRL Y-17324]|uniref:Transcription factor TFIIIC, tau55 subunit n=1 Tax=Suhomyces tanzawaensis NRRL Y-17324 TaxID=984487 RepID=A0A1E4SHU0_9ASCO|nr:transcription factor TFIIIC, tau55 subunit [Suhomyces tanzawaensis NRRL Y-17324]ODV79063.1 transcription factor TFIIIC, tau55 subunit [Suhomyces tanzawaensis NRRL Y-17324]